MLMFVLNQNKVKPLMRDLNDDTAKKIVFDWTTETFGLLLITEQNVPI